MIAGAIDFGGTKLAVGLVGAGGAVLEAVTVPTPRDGGPEVVADAATALLGGLLAKHGLEPADLEGIGSTVPGLADTERGVLRHAPGLGWREVPFAAMLEARLGRPVRIANDVNACALAELRFGAGRDLGPGADLVWITVSTGIGGAIVLGGRLVEGSGGIAGEVGHLVVEEGGPLCGCGHRGCLEAVAAGPAIARRAREAGLDVADAREVADIARQGHPAARGVMEQTGAYLGRAVAACLNLLDPDLVVFGGGVSQSLDLMLPALTSAALERAITLPERPPRIELTALGQSAALVGAAALVLPGDCALVPSPPVGEG